MTIAYSYTRLSTEKQLKGYGAQRQQEAIERAAEHYGWQLSDRTFKDFGVSAWKGRNRLEGALSEFINLAREGLIESNSVLIVESIDRLSREAVETSVSLMLQLTELGIKVYSLSDDRLYERGSPNAMLNLMSWIMVAQRANEESEMKSQRIRDARDRAKAGARQGQLMNRRLPAWLEWGEERKSMEVVSEIADVVRRVFQMYVDGMSTKPIAIRLNEEGVKYWGRSDNWTYITVRNLLKQEAVTGKFQPLKRMNGKDVPDGDPILDYYPRIISQELWATATNLKNSKATSRGRHTEESEMKNLFKGVLKCSCGSGLALNSSVQKGKRYYALRCSQLRSGTCKEKNWHYGAFEKIVLLGLEKMDWSSLLDKSERFNELEDMKARAEVLRLEQTDLNQKVSNLTNAIASRPDSNALLDALDKVEVSLRSVDKTLIELDTDIARVETEQQAKDDRLNEIQDVFEEVANAPDARYKVNQIINKNIDSIKAGTADSYQTYDKLKDAVDDEGNPALPDGDDIFKGYIEIVPKAGSPVRIDVLNGYKRSFLWNEAGGFDELLIQHTAYTPRHR